MSACWFPTYYKIPAWSLLSISCRWGRISDIFQLCPQWGTYAEVTANILQSFDFSRSSHYACLQDSHALSSFWFNFFFIIYSKQASELREQQNSSIRGNNQLRNVRVFLPSYKCFRCAPMPIIPSYVRLMGFFRTFSNKCTSFLPLVNGSVKHYSECSLHLWAGISILRHPQWSLDAHKGWKDHSLGRKCSTPLPLPRATPQKIQHLAHPQVLTVLQIGWTPMTMVQR